MKLFYLGPENTYSHSAAKKSATAITPPPELVPRLPLETVVSSLVLSGSEPALALVPYYNYLEGLVQETLDLIYENEIYIVGSQRLPVRLCLGGFSPEAPEAVYSHPKALAQCSQYLHKHFPDIPLITTASTTAAAEKVAASGSGMAIASQAALETNGIPILAEDIGNTKYGVSNFTDFFLVSKKSQPLSPPESHLTMVAITPHVDRIGLLQDILLQIAYFDINLAKIHSRPAIDRVENAGDEPQMFYLEMVCGQNQERFTRCVDTLQYKFSQPGGLDAVRVLGSYPPLYKSL
ncbi:MAG: hypothetical protein JXA25_12375 [Anaerolineales bacterium]|nr:hypothetical protein [Anaerolineales bacterium]